MSHAVVLVKSEREALATLGAELAKIEGVTEAFSVTGQWDFVVVLRLRRAEDLSEVVTGGIAAVAGVADTYTMAAFEAFSQHDLDAIFSAGS